VINNGNLVKQKLRKHTIALPEVLDFAGLDAETKEFFTVMV